MQVSDNNIYSERHSLGHFIEVESLGPAELGRAGVRGYQDDELPNNEDLLDETRQPSGSPHCRSKRTYDDISDDHSSDAAYSGGASHDDLETASVPDCKATEPAFVRHPLLLFAPDGPENEPSPIVWGFDSPEPSDEWKEFPRIMMKRQRRNLRRSSFSAVDWLDPQPIRGLRGDPRNPQFHLTITHPVPAQSLARHNYREEAASSVLSSEAAPRQRAASSSPRTPRPPYGGGKPAFGERESMLVMGGGKQFLPNFVTNFRATPILAWY
ncbi:hypothetical protein M434DRAFT_33067 [Hypoxylon sp. CO27-5]|nr:hypothetical protein M434DRAFT_33067 [Hypoxylon sp. CO27-5]